MRIGQKLSAPLLFLMISTIITGITENKNPIPYTLIFIAITIPLFFIKKEIHKNILSWIILIISIPTFIDKTNDISNMNGYFLFLFSVSIAIKSPKIYIVYFSIFISALLFKFNILNSAPSQIIAYLSALSFIGIFYQHYIHPKKHNNSIDYSKKVIEKLQIDNTVCLIMIDYVKGYTWDDISKNLKLNVTGDRVQRIVKKEMTEKGYHNYADLCCYLTDVGIIKAIDKNLITE